jgi:hypothetical protein
MDLEEVILSSSASELAHSLDKRRTLDITNRSSQLNDAHIWRLIGIIDWNLRDTLNPVLDGICQMWNDLNCASEVIATSLLLDNMLVDLAGCDVVLASERNVEITLVVSEVEVYFSAIVKDEHFTVPVQIVLASSSIIFLITYPTHPSFSASGKKHSLGGRHGSGIDVHVWINLDARNLETDGLEQQSGGRG